MNHYGLVMAGGGGTRFWPLSRKKTPKQLLNLSGRDYMVNESIDRVANVIGKSNIFVITSETQAASMINVTSSRIYQQNILAEPAARNTAACIGYAAMYILHKYGDGVMIITPADHYIENTGLLVDAFKNAIKCAEERDKLITIGVKPRFPATGYGYIKYTGTGEIKEVEEFIEKPPKEVAWEYVNSGEYAWNSGMFIWKASLILRKMKHFVPDIYEKLVMIGEAMSTPSEQEVLHELYPSIRNISIDYAVMEPAAKCGDVLLLPCECGWSDIGSWDMMEILHKANAEKNVLLGDAITVNVKNSVIVSTSRPVTAVDVENLVIVETPDVIMVCQKDKAQHVKQIVDELKSRDHQELL